MYKMCFLPNKGGFNFIGVDHNGDEHCCHVGKDKLGMHSVFRNIDNEPFWFRLAYWREPTKQELESGKFQYGKSDALLTELGGEK